MSERPVFTVGGVGVYLSDITDSVTETPRTTRSEPVKRITLSSEALRRCFLTGQVRQLVANAPDPIRPVFVGTLIAFRFLGLSPGEVPRIEADAVPTGWARDRAGRRDAQRRRAATKRRRGWA